MRITHSQIQHNDFAATSFYAAMDYNVKRIRENIDIYKKLRKVNSSIFGNVHALSLLCVHANNFDIPIILKEAQNWQEVLTKYAQRISKKIPEDIRDEFTSNLLKDLETIVSKAKDYPERDWIEKFLSREITIRVKTEELKEKYQTLAEAKEEYKDRLGNALHNYISDCLEALEDDKPTTETTNAIDTKLKTEIKSLSPTFLSLNDSSYSYLLSDFEYFRTHPKLKSLEEISAYDLENFVQTHLQENDPKLFEALSFDCESSLFSVQASSMQSLVALNNALLNLI